MKYLSCFSEQTFTFALCCLLLFRLSLFSHRLFKPGLSVSNSYRRKNFLEMHLTTLNSKLIPVGSGCYSIEACFTAAYFEKTCLKILIESQVFLYFYTAQESMRFFEVKARGLKGFLSVSFFN